MFTTNNVAEHLIRSEIWSAQIKEVLQDELMGMRYVTMMTEFPDGEEINIPSIGEAEVDNYIEDTAVKYRAMDTGNFKFRITEYVTSATYITDKAKQDSFYMNQLVSSFVPKQARAIMQRFENDVMALANEQTAGDANSINGAPHRFRAQGTNGVMDVKDFAAALFSLKKANVGDSNLTAIVDPSVEFTMNTLTSLVSLSDNPRWEGIVADGIATGPKFVKNIYGFDVYTSNYVADAPAGESLTLADGTSSNSVAGYKANMFFSARSDILPFMGAWRQMPRVESERNKDMQRDEYVTSARYGLALYRPENLVVVMSNPAAL